MSQTPQAPSNSIEYLDPLTGGLNRTGFIRATEKILEDAGGERYAVLFFNIKNFKAINDVFGTAGSDVLLKRLHQSMLASPLEPALVSRFEADHFVWLIKQSNLDYSQLGQILEGEWTADGKTVQLYIHCGIYCVEDPTIPVVIMVDRANLARHNAEAGHAEHYYIFDKTAYSSYIDQADILSEFQGALDNHQFEVYLQPIVNAKSGVVVSAEALLRWNHPTRGVISPGFFVPVLEKNGHIPKLDEYVLDTVFNMLVERDLAGKHSVPIAINLSWLDFYNERLVDKLVELLHVVTNHNTHINVELTETSFAALEQNRSDLLAQFKDAGARILLDDFGSGYSSFAMIRDYEFDTLKLDMSFVRQLDTNPKARCIVESIIALCHRLDLTVIAEGVETEAELGFLRAAGCDLIQGFLFSRPLPYHDFEQYMRTHRTATLGEKDPEYPLATMPEVALSSQLKKVLDATGQFIQICDPATYRMVYANAATLQMSGHPEEPYVGRLCYQYMLGLDAPCGHCPLRQMQGQTERDLEVDDGQHVFALKARIMDWNGRPVFAEFGRDITATKRRHMQAVESKLTETQNRLDVADHERRTDFLTGLSNRLDLFDYIRDSVSGARPQITAMMMIDIDDFKQLNDTHGHLAGDECLKRIGAALQVFGEQHNIRFFRYGGEEFLGICHRDSDPVDLAAHSVLELIRGLHIMHGSSALEAVTASIGFTTNNSRYEKMVDLADQAMYRAKRAGKNQIVHAE